MIWAAHPDLSINIQSYSRCLILRFNSSNVCASFEESGADRSNGKNPKPGSTGRWLHQLHIDPARSNRSAKRRSSAETPRDLRRHLFLSLDSFKLLAVGYTEPELQTRSRDAAAQSPQHQAFGGMAGFRYSPRTSPSIRRAE